jgi:hypothetical protein
VGLTLPRSLLAIALAGAGFAAGFVLAPRHGDRGAVGGLPVVEHVQRVSLTGLSQVARLPSLAGAKQAPNRASGLAPEHRSPISPQPPTSSPKPLPSPSPKPAPTNTNTSPTPPPFQPHSGTGG